MMKNPNKTPTFTLHLATGTGPIPVWLDKYNRWIVCTTALTTLLNIPRHVNKIHITTTRNNPPPDNYTRLHLYHQHLETEEKPHHIPANFTHQTPPNAKPHEYHATMHTTFAFMRLLAKMTPPTDGTIAIWIEKEPLK